MLAHIHSITSHSPYWYAILTSKSISFIQRNSVEVCNEGEDAKEHQNGEHDAHNDGTQNNACDKSC